MLNKILAVNDDPEIQSKARAQLALLKGDFEKEVAIAPRRNELFAKAWKADLGYLRKDAMLVVGPQVNTANCAGLTAVERSDCAVTWREWFARKLPVSTD
jgi:hypothetical protein